MATKSRYCYSPMTCKKVWKHDSILERIWIRFMRWLNAGQVQLNYYTGYNDPVYPSDWDIQ